MAIPGGEKTLFQKVRLNEVVVKFTGEGDVAEWIDQVRIAKRIMQLTDSDLADLAALALKDKAFAVYKQMPDAKKSNFEEIANALMTAFAEDKLSAHAAATNRKYVDGEGVDAFMNELKRLGGIAKASDDTIQAWFILGLPTEVAKRMRSTPKVFNLPEDALLEMARAMVQMEEATSQMAAAVVADKEADKVMAAVAKSVPSGCFECGGNHIVRFCPKVKNGISQITGKRWNSGWQQRAGQRPRPGAGWQGDRQVDGQWVFQPSRPVALDVDDSKSGNEFGLSLAQASAQYN